MADPPILEVVRQRILERHLPGEDPVNLTDGTPLITGGIIDSLGLLDLVGFLEQQFDIEFEAHEVTQDRFETLSAIAGLVREKLTRTG